MLELVDVAVIWRPRASMSEAFEQAALWWRSHGVTVSFVDCPKPEWSTAAARNEAMRSLGRPGRALVIADADTHPEDLDSVVAAVEGATADPQAVYLPYRMCKVREPGSDGRVLGSFSWSCGGIYVATPEAWWGAGGQDERFIGWAPEDFAFAIAHRTMTGRDLLRVDGTIYSISHPANPGKERRNRPHPLFEQYKNGDGDRAKMAAILKSANGGPTGTGQELA